MKEQPIMTSIKISKAIHNQLIQTVVKQGYGMRGKTKWIIEAINEFLTLPEKNYADLADIACEMTALNEVISLRLPDAIMLSLEKAVIVIRTFYPSMEGVKSNIIRASILQRLIRN